MRRIIRRNRRVNCYLSGRASAKRRSLDHEQQCQQGAHVAALLSDCSVGVLSSSSDTCAIIHQFLAVCCLSHLIEVLTGINIQLYRDSSCPHLRRKRASSFIPADWNSPRPFNSTMSRGCVCFGRTSGGFITFDTLASRIVQGSIT